LIRNSPLQPKGTRRSSGPARGAAAVAAAALTFGAVAFAAEPPAAAEDAASSGAAVFASRCAVCHGPQAAGIPGTFPSLHEQIRAFAKTPEGRDYLVMVVTTGLMGSLNVGGVNYTGVMPAQSGLSEAEVAAVLSFLASGPGKSESAAPALSANDVTEARARHPDRAAQSTRALRPATDP
jgi:mono/diheme cytochrome c family protein